MISFKSLDIDKGEWLEDIERGDSSFASFFACVEECISEGESRKYILKLYKLKAFKCITLSDWPYCIRACVYNLQILSSHVLTR